MPLYLRHAALLATTLLALLLTACGGGGGGGSTTPVVVTPPGGTQSVTFTASTPCASGPALTSSVSQAAANALVPSGCPALPATAYSATTVVAGSGTLSLTITGLPAGFVDGVLTATGAASGGVWDVVSTATGITVTPRAGAVANWATSYSGTLGMCFTNAPCVTKNIAFTTGANPTPPFAWPSDVKVLMEPGIVNGVVNPALAVRTWLPLNPVTNIVGDANWNANLANGNVQIVKSGEMAPDINGIQRNIWRAVYRKASGSSCISQIFADTGTSYLSDRGDNQIGVSCITSALTYVVGVSDTSNPANNSVIYRGSGPDSHLCYRNTAVRGDEPIACPF